VRSEALRRSAGFAVLLAACGGSFQRFDTTPVVWLDPDQAAVSAPDERAYAPRWDAMDQIAFRPAARTFAFDPVRRAANVNAVDEVPSSSWYTNRLSVRDLTTREMIEGRCRGVPRLDVNGPLTVVGEVAGGVLVRDLSGRRYALLPDDETGLRAAAEVIGSIVYWAAGYETPCAHVVTVDPARLEGADAALPEVAFRAAAIPALPGRDLGPWRWDGTRDDDDNDVVPHEDRRELRGAIVLASWINHTESNATTTAARWLGGERGFVRHYHARFGDSLGRLFRRDSVSRRVGAGTSGYLDVPHVATDFATLGIVSRPWHHAEPGSFGYFEAETFDPEQWRPAYPNPAFLRATEDDLAWGGRLLAMFDADDVEAIVGEAQLPDAARRQRLIEVLRERRRRILRRAFRHRSPLAWPTVEASEDGGVDLCLEDLAVRAGLHDWSARPYWARAWREQSGFAEVPLGRLVRRPPEWVCVALPDAPEGDYLVVDVAGLDSADGTDSRPARVHLIRDAEGFRIVGLERPATLDPPG